ncbi:hypothetical protein HR060_10470 [Catenovulum sp. SM1970]|uniref:hypothetical protein n=1 Tax=Marinifaba aquimaris TaxID=2741323 RepID=UPI0015743AF3|nr:hypothetical protein [Marinifaba aquimaris]NTS77288.1 hypothetical protein [Marinifaba aquimaris]
MFKKTTDVKTSEVNDADDHIFDLLFDGLDWHEDEFNQFQQTQAERMQAKALAPKH